MSCGNCWDEKRCGSAPGVGASETGATRGPRRGSVEMVAGALMLVVGAVRLRQRRRTAVQPAQQRKG
jgi:hypothetical protein